MEKLRKMLENQRQSEKLEAERVSQFVAETKKFESNFKTCQKKVIRPEFDKASKHFEDQGCIVTLSKNLETFSIEEELFTDTDVLDVDVNGEDYRIWVYAEVYNHKIVIETKHGSTRTKKQFSSVEISPEILEEIIMDGYLEAIR